MHRLVSQVHLHNNLVGFFLATLGVFYGLLMGLVAVSAWEMHENAETMVAREAAAVAALYRDVSVYPEPERTQLQALLKEYVRFVIEEAWPVQRHGTVSGDGYPRVAALEHALVDELSRSRRARSSSTRKRCASSTSSSRRGSSGSKG